jgi:hypothetical protein
MAPPRRDNYGRGPQMTTEPVLSSPPPAAATTDRRVSRLVLAVEVALGVLPVTIVGGVYAVIGTMFGMFSVLFSVQRHAYDGIPFWMGVLALAFGGITGIAGLWMLVAAAWAGGDRKLRNTALMASGVGILTAAVALAQASRREAPHWSVIYLLVSPIVVVCHRAWADASVRHE